MGSSEFKLSVLQMNGAIMRSYFRCFDAMNKEFGLNVYEKYGVDQYYSEHGLSVSPNFRKRRIGEYLLKARKEIGPACGLKLTNIFYTSDFSNKCGLKAGYTLEGKLTWDELRKIDPECVFPNIESQAYTNQTWVF